MTTWQLAPITPDAAARLRALGGDVMVADAKPGYPCRQCLRDAEPGETLVLVAHDPFTIDSPYRSSSPIFLHATDCGAPDSGGALPEQLTVRQLSVRAFDDTARMIDAAVLDGTDLGSCLDRMFADRATSFVHVHNASRGCWAVSVERV